MVNRRVACGACVVLLSGSLPVASAFGAAAHIEEILVTAHPLSGAGRGLSQAGSALQGEELDRKRAFSIGETLGREPGIHSASFGQAVGRPVIHGLGGPRVKVMEDRLDSLDVSVTSGDHAVTVDPFIAERIEVLKGSSALLFGSGAIGGVVDVHTGRIPHRVPESGIVGGFDLRYDTNGNGRQLAAKLDAGGEQTAWHLDATSRRVDDYEIPGAALSDGFLTTRPELAGAVARGKLPGSFVDSDGLAVGASRFGARGFVGASISRARAAYGLPGLEDDTPQLDLEQRRYTVETGVDNPLAGFESLSVQLAGVRYRHQEIEPSGEVATRFRNDAWEGRAELVYGSESARGVFGLQLSGKELAAVGEESFIPRVRSREWGAFWVGERLRPRFDVELGARLGRVEHAVVSGADADFSVFALSAGIVVPLSEALALGVLADYSSRAPVAEELFSNGPHLVTRTFEIGNAQLDQEQARGLSATLQFGSDNWRASLGAYYNRFDEFVYQQLTSARIEGLPVVRYRQADATFRGLDAALNGEIVAWPEGALEFRATFDLVDAQLKRPANIGSGLGRNLPRIPPLRASAGLTIRVRAFTASLDLLYVDAQNEVADGELRSPGYRQLTAFAGRSWTFGRNEVELYVKGENLLDEEQREHTSFIKDLAPARGRSIQFGMRCTF